MKMIFKIDGDMTENYFSPITLLSLSASYRVKFGHTVF